MTRQSISEHEGAKYIRMIEPCLYSDDSGVLFKTIPVDVYCVLDAFNITCPATAHAIKKLLTPGQRGKGDRLADLKGAMAALNRAIDKEERRIKRAEVDSAKSNGPMEGTKVDRLMVQIHKDDPLPARGTNIKVNFLGNCLELKVVDQYSDLHRVGAVPISKEVSLAEALKEAFLKP